MYRRIPVYILIAKSTAVLELLAPIEQSLPMRGSSLFPPYFRPYALDLVVGFYIQNNRSARRLYKDLHARLASGCWPDT